MDNLGSKLHQKTHATNVSGHLSNHIAMPCQPPKTIKELHENMFEVSQDNLAAA